jgi:hypothetical protein
LVTKQQEATALTMRAQQADRIQRLRERMVHAVEGYGSIQDPRVLMEAGARMNPSRCEMFTFGVGLLVSSEYLHYIRVKSTK